MYWHIDSVNRNVDGKQIFSFPFQILVALSALEPQHIQKT